MKRSIITAMLLVAISPAFSQQHLPSKVTITLTDKQVLRLDSAIQMGSGIMDSKQQTKWFLTSFDALYQEVRKQLITDTLKKKKP